MGQANDGNEVACIPPNPHKRHLYLPVKDTTGISLELHLTLDHQKTFPWQGLVWGVSCVSILILRGAQDPPKGLLGSQARKKAE